MVGNSNRVEDFTSIPVFDEAVAAAAATFPVPMPASSPSTDPHKVCLPLSQTAFQRLRHGFSETFFPDDPFHQFKNQSRLRKAVLALQYFFPILQWAPTYSLSLFKSDIVSGLTIASLAIPQGISYAKLANLPPIIGLYSSFVPPLIYAVLGSSRDLAVGPVSIASLVMGSMLREAVSPTHQPLLFLQLAFTATFFAGIFQASLGFLRLGFIVDFLSRPTLVGFMAGAAIIVSLQQLKGLLGIVHFAPQMNIVPVVQSVVKRRDEWEWQTILMGACFLLLLLTARHISLRKPKLFWVSAAAPLASVVSSTLLVFIFKAQNHGIQIIGHLDEGLNPPSANLLYFRGPLLGLAIKTGIVTGILSLTEGIAVGRTFASLKKYHIDGNKEMMAIGLMNMAGSCCSCYVTTGSFSRSAVNYNSGSKTAVSNIVMASTVLVTLLFLMPLFYYTPNLILAGIIITAVIGLIDFRTMGRLWKVDKLDFLACMTAFLGVLFFSVQGGLSLAVGISVFKILLHVTRPNTATLGNVPGTKIYRNFMQYPEAKRIPSCLIVGIESPIYFANANYLHERVLRWVREEQERIKARRENILKYLILEMTAVTAIDTSGLGMLTELKRTLENQSITLLLVNPIGEVMEKLQDSDSLAAIGSDCLYLTVDEAILSIALKVQLQP
ncbi:probable sulfate transporter 3.4 [Nymphaea colorata]|nr:probable sulfate transporter 3.4 [Nymphaea colorata]